MTDAREIIARQIEPQAWAALGIGDTLAYRNRRTSSDRKAIRIMQELAAAGIRLAGPGDRILGPDEVDPVTVEKAADIADNLAHVDNQSEYNQGLFDAAAAIRALGRKA